MDESTGPLQSGATYLFTTRYDSENDYYTLNSHPNASKLLSSDGAENDADLKTLADKDEKVKALEVAYPDEQLLEADVYHSNTRNEFKSLPKAKAAAQSRADSAKLSLYENEKAQYGLVLCEFDDTIPNYIKNGSVKPFFIFTKS